MKYAILLVCVVGQAWAADSIAGTWLLRSQEVAGQKTSSRPLTLRIAQSGNTLEFEYSVTVAQKREVSLRFTAPLNGAEGDIRNSAGQKIGTVRLTRAGASQFLLSLEGPNRPTSAGKLSVSADGKTLTSESDAVAAGGTKTHTVQIFERQ